MIPSWMPNWMLYPGSYVNYADGCGNIYFKITLNEFGELLRRDMGEGTIASDHETDRTLNDFNRRMLELSRKRESARTDDEIDDQLDTAGIDYNRMSHFVHWTNRAGLLRSLAEYGRILGDSFHSNNTWNGTPITSLEDDQLRKIVLLTYHAFGGLYG